MVTGESGHVVYVDHAEAKGRVDHCHEVGRGEGFQVGGAGGRGGPDEGGVVAGESEEGDGTGGEEALVGCCVVVYLWSGVGVGVGV